MNKWRNILIMVVAMFGLTGCDSELDSATTISFIGDSLIARWDLQEYFSSFITYNNGRSGAGIDYLVQKAGTMNNKNVAVIIGTNDIAMMTTDGINEEEYAMRYVSAIEGLGAKKIYLYEIPPRSFTNDRAGINNDIRKINNLISRRIAGMNNVYYIKIYDDFIDHDGCINVEYYSDGLHLSPMGYEVLSSKLSDML